MTKQELIKILDEKIEKNIIKRNEIIPNNTSIYKLNGKIEDYTDIKSLLEKEWFYGQYKVCSSKFKSKA